MFSGVVSDMMTSRKSAITLGFAMGACAKFGMSFAGSVGQLFASKAIDRLANGVQAAPRDALISDLAPADTRSACFGFAQVRSTADRYTVNLAGLDGVFTMQMKNIYIYIYL